jgi:hypothetical protein
VSESITVKGGRVTVARAEHKDDVDVDLSNVESVHYERPVMGGTGALVIRERDSDEDVVIRVDEEDAPEALSAIVAGIPTNSATENQAEPAPEAPTQAPRNSGPKPANRR